MRSLPLALTLLLVSTLDARQMTPQSIVDELLAADRSFSVASGRLDGVNGLSAMFADEVLLTHAGGVAIGKANAVEALRRNSSGARIEWTPLRAGISGDGRHGFTAGFMTATPASGAPLPLKYLAYWVQQPTGWRVLAYKRGPAKALPALTPLPNVLPVRLVASTSDAARIEQYRQSLADAETAFSSDAQTMGIGAAFKQYGSPEAINLGGPEVPVFLLGNQDIGNAVGGGAPGSPVRWGPDVKTIVAASGDFGVTIGHIVPHAPAADGKPQPGRPFFTIWRRDSPDAPWRYIAE